jgi:flagellar hook-length control protein FliK
MNPIASLDFGAIAANRQASAPTKGAPRGPHDFMAAYRHASHETRKTERPQDADRAPESRTERDDDTAAATETQAAQAQAPEKPQPKDQADAASDTQAQAPKADAQATQRDDQQATQAQAQAQADQQANAADAKATTDATAQAAADARVRSEALDAQAVLALQLATGGQLAAPVAPAVTEQSAPAAARAQAVTAATTTGTDQAADGFAAAQAILTAVDANAPTDPQLDQAIQQALRQATADTQAAKPQAQAAQAATAQGAAAPTALDAAAQALNVTEVKAQPKPQNPNAPAFANTAAAQPEKPSNLMLELIDRAPIEITQGSITPATTLDGALGTETNANAVALLTDEEATEVVSADADGVSVQAPLLNGDRTGVEAAKAPAAADKPQAPVRPEDVMPQVLKHAEQIKANQANTIKLQLYPEHLGKMEIKVMAHQGVLSAQISADSQAVKSMLETQVAQLQRSFAEMGLKVEKVEVALSSSNLGNESSFGGQAMSQGDAQQFGQQPHQSGRSLSQSGYGQWLGDEPVDEATMAEIESATAVNYVA